MSPTSSLTAAPLHHTFRTAFSLAAFALLTTVLVVSRPRAFFREHDGRPRPFGFGRGETLFPLGLALGTLALLSAFFFAVAEMSFSCSHAPPPPHSFLVMP